MAVQAPPAKRIVDLSAATVLLVLFAPVMLMVAVLIRCCMGRPILFRQVRAGYRGEPFTLIKFRTMCQSRDADGRLLPDAQRLTRLGRLIRSTSLDELPQLFNVLKGEMSLVGPRPPILYEVKYYKYWHLQRIFKAKPGITGLWQLYGRSVCTFDDMVRYDLKYIEQFSLWLDIKIIFKTLFVFIRQNGAL